MNQSDIKTSGLKKLRDYYEQERDKLYDQVANLQGKKEQMDWSIKIVNALIHQIEQEEKQRQLAIIKQEEALKSAREKGNIGEHPDKRKQSVQERRKESRQKIEKQAKDS